MLYSSGILLEFYLLSFVTRHVTDIAHSTSKLSFLRKLKSNVLGSSLPSQGHRLDSCFRGNDFIT